MRDVPIGSNALAAVEPLNFAARRREIVSCIVGRLVRPPVSPRRTGQRSVIFPLFDLRDKRVKRLRTGDAPAHRINLHHLNTESLESSRGSLPGPGTEAEQSVKLTCRRSMRHERL